MDDIIKALEREELRNAAEEGIRRRRQRVRSPKEDKINGMSLEELIEKTYWQSALIERSYKSRPYETPSKAIVKENDSDPNIRELFSRFQSPPAALLLRKSRQNQGDFEVVPCNERGADLQEANILSLPQNDQAAQAVAECYERTRKPFELLIGAQNSYLRWPYHEHAAIRSELLNYVSENGDQRGVLERDLRKLILGDIGEKKEEKTRIIPLRRRASTGETPINNTFVEHPASLPSSLPKVFWALPFTRKADVPVTDRRDIIWNTHSPDSRQQLINAIHRVAEGRDQFPMHGDPGTQIEYGALPQTLETPINPPIPEEPDAQALPYRSVLDLPQTSDYIPLGSKDDLTSKGEPPQQVDRTQAKELGGGESSLPAQEESIDNALGTELSLGIGGEGASSVLSPDRGSVEETSSREKDHSIILESEPLVRKGSSSGASRSSQKGDNLSR